MSVADPERTAQRDELHRLRDELAAKLREISNLRVENGKLRYAAEGKPVTLPAPERTRGEIESAVLEEVAVFLTAEWCETASGLVRDFATARRVIIR